MTRLAELIATWFGSGYLPKAPGTWGSLAALPFAWAILTFFPGPYVLLVASAVLLPVGVWASTRHSETLGTHDAGEIVVDEVVGQWIVLSVAPFSLLGWLAAFVLFRIFDVLKPWPISWIDKRISGGWGIMLDDVAAGLFGALAVSLIVFVVGEF
ncbi:phosphatidylglycerophosphatase A [Parvibaculaceae bacterium PLY_AMNH_Bact1]|nr:phosphatidylglycerophosphatase A [Parvibaculaceae bacterium PLY_AMNH_Bact1]